MIYKLRNFEKEERLASFFALLHNLLVPDHRGQEQASVSNKEGFRSSSLNECLYSRRYQEHLPWTVRSEQCCSDFRLLQGMTA